MSTPDDRIDRVTFNRLELICHTENGETFSFSLVVGEDGRFRLGGMGGNERFMSLFDEVGADGVDDLGVTILSKLLSPRWGG